MYWKCSSGLSSEDGTLDEIENEHGHSSFFMRGVEAPDDFSSLRSSNMTWWRWVGYYSDRVLTRSDDRAAAMTGMIRYFQRLTGESPC